jgi:hypothetical protein
MIVDAYVGLKDRKKLQDLLAHRERLLIELTGVSGVDPKQAVQQVTEEIAVIRAGLEGLDRDGQQ